MPEEILTVVRLPIADLSDEIKRKHKLAETLVDSRIEGDSLVLYFSRAAQTSSRGTLAELAAGGAEGVRSQTRSVHQIRRRIAKGRRNRMRTRGWQVVGRFENSKGQTALIYKPFVDALVAKHISPTQQKAAVAQILRANGNRPSAASIEYYWLNTVEYLRRHSTKEEVTTHAN